MPSPPDPQPVGYAPKLIGELTEGNLVVGGPSPNTMVDGGSPSAAGGVGAGTIGQLAQYAATGSAVEGATVSGDATIAAGGALTIASGAVTNAKLATMAAHTFKGNNLGVTGAPQDLTLAEVRTELGVGQYVVGFSFTGGVLANSQLIGLHRLSAAVTFPANFGDVNAFSSEAGGTVNATASTVLVVALAPTATPNTFTTIGTITIGAGSVTPTFATSGGTAKPGAKGDVLRVLGPASADASFANFYASLVAAV